MNFSELLNRGDLCNRQIITAVMSHVRRELRVPKRHRKLMYLKRVANLNAFSVIHYDLRNRYKVRFRNIRKHAPIYKYGRTCGNKMPTRCNRGFYCRSYCLLNMFRASPCPSSGAQVYYTVVAACGILCCGFFK